MNVFIVTGKRNEGKSSYLNRLYIFLNGSGLKIGGFISPGKISESGNKDFVLQRLNEKSIMHLASREYHRAYEQIGAFFFNQEAIKKGDSIIEAELKEKCDIFILDEIGPMELSGKVWHDTLKRILAMHSGILIISVRKEMLKKVIDYFGLKDVAIIDIKKTKPETAGKKILNIENYNRSLKQ